MNLTRTSKSLATIAAAGFLGLALTGAPAHAENGVGVTQAAYDSVGLLQSRHQVQSAFGSRGCVLWSGTSWDGTRLVAKLYPSTTVGTWIQVGYRETSDGVLRLSTKQMAVDPYVNAAACYR